MESSLSLIAIQMNDLKPKIKNPLKNKEICAPILQKKYSFNLNCLFLHGFLTFSISIIEMVIYFLKSSSTLFPFSTCEEPELDPIISA